MYIYLLSAPLPSELSAPAPLTLHGGAEDTLHIIEADSTLSLEPASNPAYYEVLDAVGPLTEAGFVVMNNIPVTEEGRHEFEERFRNRARQVENEPGFTAIRVLRPMNSDTYIIMTLWKSEADFEAWQKSQAFQHAHHRRDSAEGLTAQKPSILPRPSYVTRYSTVRD